MALPSSGSISIQDILAEMNRPFSTSNLNTLAVEWYEKTELEIFNKPSHSLSDWQGKKWETPAVLPEPFLDVTSLQHDGGSETHIFQIQVLSNIAWQTRVSHGPSILTLSTRSGIGNQEVIVTLSSAQNSDLRIGYIEFYGSNLSVTFNWRQSGIPIARL